MSESIDKLTSAMAAGDEDAVETFYRQYFDWLYAQARRATRRDEAFCLDVVQDAVLRIIRTIRRVDTEVPLHAWLKLVVQTTAYDRIRADRRREQRESLVTIPASDESPAQDDRLEAQLDWLRKQIAGFDPQLVRIIEMRYQQNQTLAKISDALGLSIGSIDGRLRRAIKQLRHRAGEEFADD